MQDCIFCKIIKSEIPSLKIYEDDNFISFMDISPATKGHTLIVPKCHAATLLDLPDDVSSKLLPVAKKIATALSQCFGFKGFNIIQNNGEIAGQTVPHFHLHIIPRYEKDELGLWTPHPNDPSCTKEIAEKIKSFIK